MTRKIICILIIATFLVSSSGCATYQFGRLPSPYISEFSSPITKEGVSAATKIFTPEEEDIIFDTKMAARNIQAVFIVIENKSNINYHFRKADVSSNYIPAEEVAKKCARSTMGRLASYGVGMFVPFLWIVFVPMFIAECINCPTINRRIKSDYTSNEIADATIGPGRSISGVIFLPSLLKSGEKFNVPLTNQDTGEKLLFEFYKGGLTTEVTPKEDTEKEIKTEETGKAEPKTNIIPALTQEQKEANKLPE